MAVTYRLERAERAVADAPVLDVDQRAVVDHPGGPLLVLAGPGTGKTTTLVEAVVDRIEGRGLDPSQILVLTFSRKAAEELRDTITARLRRTTSVPMSSTFHSFCYALLRSSQSPELYATPLRLLSSPSRTSSCASCSGARGRSAPSAGRPPSTLPSAPAGSPGRSMPSSAGPASSACRPTT